MYSIRVGGISKQVDKLTGKQVSLPSFYILDLT